MAMLLHDPVCMLRCFARRRLCGVVWAVLALGTANAAAARVVPVTPPEQAPAGSIHHEAAVSAAVAQRGPVTLEQATRMAQRRHEGRVVRAETKSIGNRRLHEIRILGNDGRVHHVRIDAETGRIQ